MANYAASNVMVVDTTAVLAGPLKVKSIKYVPSKAGSAAVIRETDATGNIMWQEFGVTEKFEDAWMRVEEGLHVTVSGGAKLFLYLA